MKGVSYPTHSELYTQRHPLDGNATMTTEGHCLFQCIKPPTFDIRDWDTHEETVQVFLLVID